MKHILFIIDYYLPHRGGVENVFENIVNRLLKNGYQVSILTSRFDSNLKKTESEKNLQIYRIGKSRLSFIFLAIFKGIQILSKNKKISLIHTSTYGGAIASSILGKLFHKKVILTVHEIFGNLRYKYKGYIGFIYKLFENLIFAFPYDIYHCVSRYTMNSIRIYYGISDKKIKMIYNGIDTDFRNPKKVSDQEITKRKKKEGRGKKDILLYYGHAGISKGIDFLIEAMPDVLRDNPESILVYNLINSKRREYIKNLILSKVKNSDLKDRVVIYDGFEKNELRILLAVADAVIAPSLSEGFGSVHSECCQMGKILLTTNVSSIPEVVFGNVRFIDPSSAQEITRGVKNILHGVYDDIQAKNFSRDDTVEQLEYIYKG